MKSQISIALGRKDAINKQHMKMQVQIQCRAKALNQCHRTCMSLRYLEACLVDQVRRDRALVNAKRFSLEPGLHVGEGAFHPGGDREIFGAIGDSAPDTWGRRLMRRAERRLANQ